MASRHLLQCPELLGEIFSNLELASRPNDVDDTCATKIDREQREVRKTLTAAALSCRALTEHALVVLWRRLDSVQPLLSLLSEPKRQSSKPHLTTLQADITEQSWRRFQMHARRVRALHDKDWTGIHPSTWAFVGRWCGPEPLLPNLEELSVLPLSVQNPTSMIFMSPKLRSLSLALRFDKVAPGCGRLRKGDTVVVNMLFRQIMSIAPGIKTLSIKSNASDLPPTCFYRISDLKDIAVLHARDCVLDFAFLRWVGVRPSLHSLAATIDMEHLPPRPQDPEDEEYQEYDPFWGGFDEVKHLDIRGSPNHIHLFLAAAIPCELQVQTIEFETCAAPAAITRCIDTICNNATTGCPVLRELTLRYPDETYRDEAAGNSLQRSSLVDVIRPALGLRFLRKVTLDFHEIPSLADAGILQMIAAWPKLTALHIVPSGSSEQYRTHTKLTPSVLVALARECPRLVELTLPEVALRDVRETETDMPFVGQRALRKLRVYFRDWGRDHVLYTAALFIDRLFPCLDLSPSFEEEEDDGSYDGLSWEERGKEAEKTWRRVEEFLYAMQLGRRHRAALKDAEEP
ncbi:hypothetical protein LXA43DRAFT_1038870 [Ganoderma leucocontextum]|nr:hypothetical protein LXA43DRAFT_1038870 [Ganoderma leucocontextum]